MIVGVSDFRLRNLNFILLAVDNSEGLLIKVMTANFEFLQQNPDKRVLDTEKPEEGFKKGLAQGCKGMN